MPATIIDRILLLLCSILIFIFSLPPSTIFIPASIVIVLSCFCFFINESRFRFTVYFIFCMLCCYIPNLLFFIPLLSYEILFTKYWYCFFICILPMFFFFPGFSYISLVFIGLFVLISIYIKGRTTYYNNLKSKYVTLEKMAHELSVVQEEKTRSILENQDYEISLATLNERNRISKEIHDHVGHLLSRSLLQIGALLTLAKEEPIQEGLTNLKSSLSEGMDSIRSSIHNMHNESIDLKNSIQTLVKDFTFCPIDFQYQVTCPPSLKLKYSFIFIVKEALGNIMKHSDADFVSVSLKESDTQYSLTIFNNGDVDIKTQILLRRQEHSGEFLDGMGLQNMLERTKSFQGLFHLDFEQGFEIQIMIPKDDTFTEIL